MCCYNTVAAAAAVNHLVPAGNVCCCGSLHLILVPSFSSFKHYLFSLYPLAVPSHLRPRLAYDTSSVNTGVRGTKAGVSPPRRSPPWYYLVYHTRYVVAVVFVVLVLT